MREKTPRGLSVFWVVLTAVLAVAGGLAGARWMHEQSQHSTARTTIIWLSLDGLRGDYIRRGELPFFARLRAEGATTEQLRPAFPSTTFPSHAALATGVTADKHGITGNSFYDSGTGQLYHYPNDAGLLQAEPIWLTAQRQGVRAAVHDWPLSYAQRGAVRADVFLDAFDPAIPDRVRLERLLDVWKATIERPSAVALHLLMGYVVGTDKPGHLYGPDAPEILTEMKALDAALADFTGRATAIWQQQRHSKMDRLFFIFSTDHGMSKVRQIVSFDRLLALAPGDSDFRITTTGNIGHLSLDPKKYPIASDARAAKLRELQRRVASTNSEFRAYPREQLPDSLDYAHRTRTGDLVVILPPGFAFGSPEGGEVVADVSSGSGYVRGMHGYDVDIDPDMLGFLAIWEPARPQARELGVVSWNQLHPTVARLLGIRPAPGAAGTPLPIVTRD